jgi:hypothetical protein
MTLALMLMFAALAGGPPADDPLAPARQGRLQCHEPDLVNRRCGVMSRFEFAMDGTITNVAEFMISEQPLIIVTTRTPVTSRGGEVCGDRRMTVVSKVLVDDQPATAQEVIDVSAMLAEALQPDFGKQSCSRYSPDGQFLRSQRSVDGVRDPSSDGRILWVDPGAGFTVRPQSGV